MSDDPPGSRYSHTIQLGNQHDVHTLAVAAVPVGSSVLDIGCADGSLSKHLLERGCHIVGVDLDPAALEVAAQVLHDVRRVDLMNDLETQLLSIMEARSGQTFDVIIALDVLEHLIDPIAVLRSLVDTCLAPHGRVVVSLPNISHGAVRLALLEGQFDYRPAGLLDNTHLRFFTRDSAHALLDAASLQPIVQISVNRELDGTEIGISVDRYPEVILETVRNDPDSFTYQFFFVAVSNALSTAGALELYSFVGAANELAAQEATRRELERAVAEETTRLTAAFTFERIDLEARLVAVESERSRLDQALQVVENERQALVAPTPRNVGYVFTHAVRIVKMRLKSAIKPR